MASSTRFKISIIYIQNIHFYYIHAVHKNMAVVQCATQSFLEDFHTYLMLTIYQYIIGRISLHVMYVYRTKVPSTCIPFRLKTQKFLSINFFSKVIRLLNTEANACAVHARNVSFPKFAAAVNLHCTSINFELIIN